MFAFLHGYLCYRPEVALNEGASNDDLKNYSGSLESEVNKIDTDTLTKENMDRTQLLLNQYRQKYTIDRIFTCAKRNFEYDSEEDKEWFAIFDRYGQPIDQNKEIFEPLKKDLLNSPLIMVGNNHGMIHQIDLVMDLVDFLKNNGQNVGGLFIETNEAGAALREEIKKFAQKEIEKQKRPLTKAEAVTLAEYFLKRALPKEAFKNKPYQFHTWSRDVDEISFGLLYPHVLFRSADIRNNENRAANPSMDIDKIKKSLNLSQEVGPFFARETWISYYGSEHLIRTLKSDAQNIEFSLHLRPFIIAQGMGYWDTDLQHAKNIFGTKVNLLNLITTVFRFPEKRADSLTWYRRIEKFKLTHPNLKKRFVNLLQAEREKALSFSKNIAPVDILIVPFASNWDGKSTFDIETYAPYQEFNRMLSKK